MVNNDYFDLIADFADGSLDASQEDNLFLVLSSNEELRTQFKSHLAVKSAIRSGVGMSVVPAYSKSQIFSKLGISLPTASIPAPQTFWGNFTKFVLGNKRSIATGFVSILATAFVMFLLFNPNKSVNNIQLSDKSLNSDNIAKIESSSKDMQANPIKFNSIVNNTRKFKTGIALISSKESEPANTEITSDNNLYSNIPVTNSSFINSKNNFNLRSNNSFSEVSPIINSGFKFNSNPSGNLSIELRNSSNWFSSKPTISPKNSMALNNFGISGLYNLNQNISVGLDFRQENFFINYHGFEGIQEYNYYQQPNFSTISCLLRYKFYNFGNFKPFGQISVGANSLGFVTRGMLGTEYLIANNISLIVSGEYNKLFFNYQNNNFKSSKYSINYGFLYNF